MKKRDAGAFVYDINDPSFRAQSRLLTRDGVGGGCFGSLLCVG